MSFTINKILIGFVLISLNCTSQSKELFYTDSISKENFDSLTSSYTQMLLNNATLDSLDCAMIIKINNTIKVQYYELDSSNTSYWKYQNFIEVLESEKLMEVLDKTETQMIGNRLLYSKKYKIGYDHISDKNNYWYLRPE